MRKRRPKKHSGGRPVTVAATHVIQHRVDEATVKALDLLSEHWNCSRSEALRRAIKKAAEDLAEQKHPV